MCVSSLRLHLGLALVASASFASAQNYEQQYGPPIDVTLNDLTFNPENYDERVVRTKGRLDMLGSVGGRAYAISEGVGSTILISPMRELQGPFEAGLSALQVAHPAVGDAQIDVGHRHVGGGLGDLHEQGDAVLVLLLLE